MQDEVFALEMDGPKVWAVGALVQAVGHLVADRFGQLEVRGEISGWTLASSGHCYFSLKDALGQVRCAMFKRSAQGLIHMPKNGDQVILLGQLDIYAQRGELQFIVQSMQPVGQGALFEQFVRLKAKLQTQGLFDAQRKRALPPYPASIGVVTSPDAAALHDVLTTLSRRVPHIPVAVFASAVQGYAAAGQLVGALKTAYASHQQTGHPQVLLLVRGGGSLEDLWSFNDETLALVLAQAPMPVISGVGHEIDFTIADFVADVRAPTPTAAAELCAADREALQRHLQQLNQTAAKAVQRMVDVKHQQLDRLSQRLCKPSDQLGRQQQRLQALSHQMSRAVQTQLQRQRQNLLSCETGLNMLDPALVLQRGYAWLTDEDDRVVSQTQDAPRGKMLKASVTDGTLLLKVQ